MLSGSGCEKSPMKSNQADREGGGEGEEKGDEVQHLGFRKDLQTILNDLKTWWKG